MSALTLLPPEARSVTVNATGAAPARHRHKTDDIAPTCDCDGFCSGKCSLPTAAGPPATLTLYRLTPRNVTDLVNKDTGDAMGDAFFTVNEYDLPMRCSQGGMRPVSTHIHRTRKGGCRFARVHLPVSTGEEG